MGTIDWSQMLVGADAVDASLLAVATAAAGMFGWLWIQQAKLVDRERANNCVLIDRLDAIQLATSAELHAKQERINSLIEERAELKAQACELSPHCALRINPNGEHPERISE